MPSGASVMSIMFAAICRPAVPGSPASWIMASPEMSACSSDSPSAAYFRFMSRPLSVCKPPALGCDVDRWERSCSSTVSIRFSSGLR